jgi:hypothetical protein
MKITLPMYLLFVFVSSWVIQDVVGSDYETRLILSLSLTISFAYMENVHRKAYQAVKRFFLRAHA